MPAIRSGERTTFALSLLSLVLLWAGLSWLKADSDVLPGPAAVARIMWEEAASGRLWRHMAATLFRVIAAFGLAMLIGGTLGLILGRAPRLNRWADPYIVVFLNLPALVLIVLCYLWIGLNETAAITAVTLSKAVMVLVTVREGARTFDPALDEMAQVFRMPARERLVHIALPQLQPYLAAAARSGLSVIWKLVLVVEFLGRSEGIGFQIHLYFQLFQTGHVIAYALSFVAVMLAVEYGAIQPWERRATAWRRRGTSASRAASPAAQPPVAQRLAAD